MRNVQTEDVNNKHINTEKLQLHGLLTSCTYELNIYSFCRQPNTHTMVPPSTLLALNPLVRFLMRAHTGYTICGHSVRSATHSLSRLL